jgi:ribosome-associated toxin RatA of RatAB toxin-antitoxin module
MSCVSTAVAWSRRPILMVCAWLACSGAHAQDWVLSTEELLQLDEGKVLVPPSADRNHGDGSFRAAIEIEAPAERVFRTMTDCAQALMFVPHLERCRVLETAPDGTWQIILHEVSYDWFLPRASYVFRAEYEPFARVRFSSVRGDFRKNDGVWELIPRRDGAATIVTYRAQVVPRFYVPRWVMVAGLKRDLPALLQGLRARCESPER